MYGISLTSTVVAQRAITKLMEEYQQFFHSFQSKDVDDQGIVTDFIDNDGLKNHIRYGYRTDIQSIRNPNVVIEYSYRKFPDDYIWAFKETIRVVDRKTNKSHSVAYVYNHDLSKKEETTREKSEKDFFQWRNKILGRDPELEKRQREERAEKRKLAEEERQARIAAGTDPEMNNIIFEERLEEAYNKLKKMDTNLYEVRTIYKENDIVGYPTIMKRDIKEPPLGERYQTPEVFKTDIEDAISEYLANRDYE